MNSIVIKKAVQSAFNTQIHIPSREREIVYMRAIYYKLCKEFTFESLYSIGKQVNRHHATVLFGLKTFDNIINSNVEIEYYKKYLTLKTRIQKKLSLEIKSYEPDRFYRDKYRLKLLQNRKLYNYTKECIDMLERMGNKYPDLLYTKLNNIVNDKQYKTK